jgi:hypothetical protein
MPTIDAMMQRLLPRGTNDNVRDWDSLPPLWPPDAFAVAATLVERSGCYAHPLFAGGDASISFRMPVKDAGREHEAYVDYIHHTAAAWRDGRPEGIREITNLWAILRQHKEAEVHETDGGAEAWWNAAMLLLILADEACRGFGFVPPKGTNPLARYVAADHLRLLRGKKPKLPDPRITLCKCVPEGELCVQPKTTTVQSGCTIRSYTHNLALLPSVGEVRTSWLFAMHPGEKELQPLNLLIIPFPYQIDGRSFSPGAHCVGHEASDNNAWFFDLHQSWLEPAKSELGKFLGRLITEAHRDVDKVHGVILPELALSESLAREVADDLAKPGGNIPPEVELFITGALCPEAVSGAAPRNSVYACTFVDYKPLPWFQDKHHRWKLERSQIARYQLGDRLDPNADWWERIDVSGRRCAFRVFRPGASLAALICEDLARIDPVQTVIRAVGPNLVIALLMDAAFSERRWSYRYASVLADDPGAAVLALTSLGPIRRSHSFQTGAQRSREIALWRDPHGATHFLELPKGAHALLLTLCATYKTHYTIDGRSDRSHVDGFGGTLQLSLSGVHALTDPKNPSWARAD